MLYVTYIIYMLHILYAIYVTYMLHIYYMYKRNLGIKQLLFLGDVFSFFPFLVIFGYIGI